MEKYIIRKCEKCGCDMKLKLVGRGSNKGSIRSIDKKKRFCSKKCLNEWQREVMWEERIGFDRAEEIREIRRENFVSNNPNNDWKVRIKKSESLKKYLKENPRFGSKNGMYGKKHTEEYKKNASENKKGMVCWTEEQRQRHYENTPRGINHPNWYGALYTNGYDCKFNNKLKTIIKEKYQYKCQICGKETQKLAVHHIDYDKQNSVVENLVPLCYSCHAKTNFKRDRWIKFFKG